MKQFESAELTAFRAEVRASLEAIAPPKGWRTNYASLPDVEKDAFDRQHLDMLREAGWLAGHWPREFGGGGLTAAQEIILKLELLRVDYPQVGGGIAFFHAANTLMTHGSPEQQQRLAGILRGERWCQGFSEPDAGSDLASLKTYAALDGDHYVVNGQKIWSSGAHRAEWCLLLARTDVDAPKHKGLSLFIMAMDSPGIEVRPIRQATGICHFNEIFLDDVSIPVAHRVGPENAGWRLAQTTLGTERSAYILENQAGLLGALDALCAMMFGEQEPESGRPGHEEGCIRGEFAERAAEVHVLGMLAEKVIAGIAETGEVGPESSVLKLFYSETLQKLTDVGMRIRGVESWIDNGPVRFAPITEEWAIDHIGSWAWTIAAGTNEIQRNIIAERVLGMPRERPWIGGQPRGGCT